jgi:magnesium-protoporphyrin O-methyltransferase
MPSCCGDDYDCVFTPGEARATASRFRRQGLRGSAKDLADGVAALGERGQSLLEIGGGVGQIQVDLLSKGVALSAVNVDLSHSWEEAAQTLLSERRLEGKVQRIVADFVEKADELAPADVVILHRVVCCYPAWQRLLTAAASHAHRTLAMTFPADRPWLKALFALENLTWRLRKRGFRAHLHDPKAMLQLLSEQGLSVISDKSRVVWRTIVAMRARPAAT